MSAAGEAKARRARRRAIARAQHSSVRVSGDRSRGRMSAAGPPRGANCPEARSAKGSPISREGAQQQGLPAMPLGTGTEIDGFCLGEHMHTGSMASIYRLAGPEGELPLIIKIPRLGPGERAVNVIAFEVCRMVLGALEQSHHYPTLVAFGDVETTPYLVMEYIEGPRLNDWVADAPVAAPELARLGALIGLALHDLHRQDVVHLDLKPTNVLYRTSGEAALIDFGLANHCHYPDLLAEELRFPIGNWVYMAPEQILGVRCDPRSDIFAFGAMLYHLATGHLPFGKPTTMAQLRRRIYRQPIPPRALVADTPE